MKKGLFFCVWLVCLAMLDCLPVLGQGLRWPIEPTKTIQRLFAGYGTYDDADKQGVAPHFHEGLDIIVPANTKVVASEAGKVVFVRPDKGYSSCVFVSRGTNLNEALCYIHIKVEKNPKTNLPWAVGDDVEVGNLLGKVFKEKGLQAHLHFDWRVKLAAENWLFFMTCGPEGTPPPVENFLPEFMGNPIDLLTPLEDPATNRPTFSSPIHYKAQGGDYFKTTISGRDTVINGNVDIVARINEAFGPAGTTYFNIGPKKIEWEMVEYKPGNVAKIAKQKPVDFSGRFLQAEPSMNYSGTIIPAMGAPSNFNNVAMPVGAGVGRNAHWKFFKYGRMADEAKNRFIAATFGNLIHTIYADDKISNSVPRNPGSSSNTGIYWYFLTNIDNDNDVESTDADYYWDTNGKEGEAWNNKDDAAAHEADSNKNAAFPDGRYLLTINAQGYGDVNDQASRKDTVSVNNFNEFIYSCDDMGKLKDTFCIGEPVYIKGVGFPKNRSFRVFVIKDRKWDDGNFIPKDATRVAAVTVTSDVNGHIKPTAIWSAYAPNGSPDKGYDIVLDYNWDSLYSTPKLNKTVDVLDEKPGPFGIIGRTLKVQKSRTDVKCYGECTGAITLSVSGGTAPYTFFWGDDDNSAIGPHRTGLCADTYTVIIRDANDCLISDTIIIKEPAAKLKAVGNGVKTNCGQCNGLATISATGGTPPYSYSWPGGQLDSLCAGTYTGWVTDANGCTDSCTVTIDSSQSNLNVSCTTYHASPCDSCNGMATMVATGGTPPYTYSWPGGSLSNLCPGTYTGTVTDANGCTDSCTAIIYGLPSTLSVMGYGTPATCGQCNGTATMTASGGTAPYTYNWPGGGLSNLCPGTYVGTVTDANGCTSTCSVTILGTPPVTVACYGTPAICGQCNGSATMTASGGTPPYNYSWPGGSLSNLCPGTYTGTVTDAKGCTDSCTVTIYDMPSSLSVYCSATYAHCGQCDGSATLSAYGGTPPYTYSWPGGTLSDLCPGTYTGSVTDANGCTDSCTVTIYDMPSDLSISCSATAATCGECNGSATMFVGGGTAPYTYSWPGGTLNNLCPGIYTGWVTDANGCTDSCTVTIYGDTSDLSVFCYAEDATCGQCNGSATMTASGGTPPYNYSWPGGAMTGLCPGSYIGTVTDANGCTDSCTVTIYGDTSDLSVFCYAEDATCGQCNGSATMTASGGTPPYNYSWPGGAMTGLCPGSYIGTVTDANGCVATCSFTVFEEVPTLSVSASATNSACGQCTGTATMTASGGTPPYNYSWPGGTLTGLCPGSYTGTVTDSTGCTQSCTVTVSGDSSALGVYCTGTEATCDSCNGTASMFASGGTAPYTYSWPGGSLSNLCAGTYTGSVTDASGCTASCSITIASAMYRICDTVKVDTIRHDTIDFDSDQFARPLQQSDKLKPKHLQDIKVFPNPFDMWVNIRYYSDLASRAYITVQSATGTIVQQFTTSAVKGYNTAVIDGKRLSSGTYFVKITIGGTVVVKIYRR